MEAGEGDAMMIIPDGWKLVPVEPTYQMAAQALVSCPVFGLSINAVYPMYEAMLAAAPTPPEQECNCSMAIKLNGDGCAVCNPERAEDLSEPVSMEPVAWIDGMGIIVYSYESRCIPKDNWQPLYPAEQLATLQNKLAAHTNWLSDKVCFTKVDYKKKVEEREALQAKLEQSEKARTELLKLLAWVDKGVTCAISGSIKEAIAKYEVK